MTILNIDDAKLKAKSRLPRGLFEYLERGTENEVSLSENRNHLDAIKLVPNILVDVTKIDQQQKMLGHNRPSPIIIAPTAAAGLMWYNGEVEIAKAAKQSGVPFCVSTQSMTSIEEIAGQSGAELWFQLYIWKNRVRTLSLLERAKHAGVETLVLTVDTAMSPKREYNTRNGFGIPLQPSLKAGIDVLLHPRWAFHVLFKYLTKSGIPSYAHYPQEFRTSIGRNSLAEEVQLATDVTWDDVKKLRRNWQGNFVLKGILSENDAIV